MRDFHKIMFEHGARLKYDGSTIEVYLENSCSLKTVKDIAEALYIEFGTPSDKMRLESANKYICLIAPVLNDEVESEVSEVEREEEKTSEYNDKILSTALEVLSEHDGLTPTEIQQELAKRGVIATDRLIGMLLAKSGKAQKVGHKWYLRDSDDGRKPDSWKPLTDAVCYKVENGEVVIGQIKGDKVETLRYIPHNLLEDLYKVLPDEANSADIKAMATAVGIESLSNLETYIMRILAAEFGGELQRIGRSLVLVKGDGN